VSGHGQREAALLVDAVYWKDQVVNDVRGEQGRLSAREHQVSVNLIGEVAVLIAGYIARGEVLVSPADTVRRALNRNELPISARQAGAGRKVSRSPRAWGLAPRLHDGERRSFVVPYKGCALTRTKQR
jgi:hypothetical protein